MADGRRLPASVLITRFFAAVLGCFLFLGEIGARAAADGGVPLGALEPLLSRATTASAALRAWLLSDLTAVRWIVLSIAGVLTVALLAGGRVTFPIVPLAAGIVLGTQAQISIFEQRFWVGAALYAAAASCGVYLGFLLPLRHSQGMQHSPVREDVDDFGAALRSVCEHLLVFTITLFAIILRIYALPHLPTYIDQEVIVSWIQGRTLHGVGQYLRDFLNYSNNAGFVHVPTSRLFYSLYDTSLYSLRLGAAFWGTAAVPLFYWLARRFCNVTSAALGSVLFATAPEQLFWSRTENTFFSPVMVMTLLSAHLTMWMVRRPSFLSLLCNALAMPLGRYCYTPAWVTFALPVGVYLHGLLFRREIRRTFWYGLPIMAAGVCLWVLHISVMRSVVGDTPFQFVNPTTVYGAPIWTRHGEFQEQRWTELLRSQAKAISENLQMVARDATYDWRTFSHWYKRSDPKWPTSMNVAIVVTAVLALGYLLAQLHRSEAVMLLGWLILGLLPGVLSNEASPRRIALIFPLVQLMAAVMVDVTLRLAERTGPWRRRVVTAVMLAGGGTIGATMFTSFFSMPNEKHEFLEQMLFARRYYRAGHTVFYNLGSELPYLSGFAGIDDIVAGPPGVCHQLVARADWLEQALQPRCEFIDPVYRFTMQPTDIARRRESYQPERITFLLSDDLNHRPFIEILSAVYPDAQVEATGGPQRPLKAITVTMAQIARASMPVIRGGSESTGGIRDAVLDRVPLRTAEGDGDGVTIAGGMLLKRHGWYRFELEPPCPAASLRVGGQPAAEMRLFASGVHDFEIDLPHLHGCELPVRIVMTEEGANRRELGPGDFVAPEVASLPELRGAPVKEYAGFGAGQQIAQTQGEPFDIEADGNGNLHILTLESGQWTVTRLTAEGEQIGKWQLDVPPPIHIESMEINSRDELLLYDGARVRAFSLDGTLLREFTTEQATGTEIQSSDDHLLIAVPHKNSVAMLPLDGGPSAEFQGGFLLPRALAMSAGGLLALVEETGRVLLYRRVLDPWSFQPLQSFVASFDRLPAYARGAAFVDEELLILPNGSSPLVYDLEGNRLITRDRGRDLSAKGLDSPVGFVFRDGFLYTVDRSGFRVRKFPRLSEETASRSGMGADRS